jgi:hypothetical protein
MQVFCDALFASKMTERFFDFEVGNQGGEGILTLRQKWRKLLLIF